LFASEPSDEPTTEMIQLEVIINNDAEMIERIRDLHFIMESYKLPHEISQISNDAEMQNQNFERMSN
jgi:hypothetical protein